MTHRQKLAIFICINGLYFFSYFQRVGIPGTIFNELQSAFAMSASAVAALSAIYLYIYGGMQLFSGIMADRLGAGRMLLAGGLLLSLGSILFPLAPSLPLLYAARAIVGLGASVIFLSITREVAHLFSRDDFPIFLSLATFAGVVGGLAGTLPLERAVHYLGWRNALLAGGITCSGVLVGTAVLLQRTGLTGSTGTNLSHADIKSILRNRESFPTIFSAAMNFTLYFLVQATLGKKLLQDVCGLDSAEAALFTFLMALTGMATIAAIACTAKAIGRRKPILITATAMTLTAMGLMVCAILMHAPKGVFLLAYLLVGCSSGTSPIWCTSVKELNFEGAAGTSVGLLNAVVYLSLAVITNIAALALDAFRGAAIVTPQAVIYPSAAYLVVFIGGGILAALSFWSSLLIKESAG